MELSQLAGEHIWSGIETGQLIDEYEYIHYVKFTLDGITYLAMEDPDDGYRSHMKELQIVSGKCRIYLPNIRILCHYTEKSQHDILEFYECATGKLIMKIGTIDLDDYYPCFILEYYPEKLSINSVKEIDKDES